MTVIGLLFFFFFFLFGVHVAEKVKASLAATTWTKYTAADFQRLSYAITVKLHPQVRVKLVSSETKTVTCDFRC